MTLYCGEPNESSIEKMTIFGDVVAVNFGCGGSVPAHLHLFCNVHVALLQAVAVAVNVKLC